eukprot:NODE_290_length_10614_cov_1.553590.p11 type:complete len:131 gc:universal NODE_290_length_10614_cov_1.553590:9744-10136(+)
MQKIQVYKSLLQFLHFFVLSFLGIFLILFLIGFCIRCFLFFFIGFLVLFLVCLFVDFFIFFSFVIGKVILSFIQFNHFFSFSEWLNFYFSAIFNFNFLDRSIFVVGFCLLNFSNNIHTFQYFTKNNMLTI